MIYIVRTPIADPSVRKILKLITIPIIHYDASGKLFDYYLRGFM